MTNEIISFIIGAVAPFIISGLGKLGLKGVGMLWASYAVSVALAVGVNLFNGQLDVAEVTKSVAVIVATSQTIFHTFKAKLQA